MTIRTLADAEAALMPYVPLARQLLGKDITLERIVPLMELLGNPEQHLRVVHIAGTSGKTSTAYFMSALLVAAGSKVGLTVSPHVDSITERIQIDGQPLDEANFCSELGNFLDIIQRAKQMPTYFELIYAFALWEFDRQGVDYAVVETGLGGLHDATNVITRSDKVCIITDIGHDHTNVLGAELVEIAAQKIGIVHTGNQVFTYDQSPEIMAVLGRWVNDHQANLFVTTEYEALQQFGKMAFGQMPIYQRRNWLLADTVFNYLRNRDKLPNLTRQVLQLTQAVQVPARMEARQLGGKTIVMDGAHNAQKMTAFIGSFQQQYPGQEPAVLLALKQDKEYQSVVPLLAALTSHIIITTFESTQDLPIRSMDPDELAKAFTAANVANVTVIPDHHQAYEALLSSAEPIGVITGSLYLLGQIRNSEGLV